MKKHYFLFLFFFLGVVMVHAQDDDLLSLIEEEPVTDYATASFKTNRVVNLHSLENTAKGVFDFKISHRFNTIDQGFYDWFGLDGATIRIGGDFGITDQLQIGIGRSTINKTYDGYVKYKFLRQSTGKKNMPVTAAFFAGTALNTLKAVDPARKPPFADRFDFTFQAIIGRKFSEGFSLQLSPTLVHRNLVPTRAESNDVFALGIGARQKITKRVAINVEYIYVLPDQLDPRFTNSLSVGFDIETGGHVFQLHFTNSRGMFESNYITQTNEKWFGNAGDALGIHFGFNISRVFTVY
ncbi:MAG: DUF5777 family beta-barrel protein [Saprospiraceae bacterium]